MYLKILDICNIFYGELIIKFNTLNIQYVENVYSFYAYFEDVRNALKYFKLDSKKIINVFYDNFINKKIKINLFTNRYIKSNDNYDKNCTSIPKQENTQDNDLNVMNLEIDDIVVEIDLENKTIMNNRTLLTFYIVMHYIWTFVYFELTVYDVSRLVNLHTCTLTQSDTSLNIFTDKR
ncbi:hypothetical protein COBT_003714, partial [Conglomerata obtusa]